MKTHSRTRIPTVTRTTARRSDLLVPAAVRRHFDQLLVNVTFSVRALHVAEFEKLCRSLGDPADLFGFSVTDKSDPETALTVHRLGRRRSERRFHALIEFRRGRVSPYRKISTRHMQALLRFFKERGMDMRLERWQQAIEVGEGAEAVQAALSPAKTHVLGHPAKITSLGMVLEPADKPAVTLLFRRTGDKIVVETGTPGGSIASLEEAFSVGPTLLAGLFPSSSSAEVNA